MSLPGFARAKPQKLLIDIPWGKPGDSKSPIMLCKTLKRKGKSPTLVSGKLKALGTLPHSQTAPGTLLKVTPTQSLLGFVESVSVARKAGGFPCKLWWSCRTQL